MFKRMSLVSPHCLFSRFFRILAALPGFSLTMTLGDSEKENVKEDVIDEGDMNLFCEELFSWLSWRGDLLVAWSNESI